MALYPQLTVSEPDFFSILQAFFQAGNARNTSLTRQWKRSISSEVVEICVDHFHRILAGLGCEVNCWLIWVGVAGPGVTVTWFAPAPGLGTTSPPMHRSCPAVVTLTWPCGKGPPPTPPVVARSCTDTPARDCAEN